MEKPIHQPITLKPKNKKHKKYSQIDLNVNPMRKAEKLFRYSSIRETDWSLLTDLNTEDVQHTQVKGYQVIKFKFPEGAYLVKKFLSRQEQLSISQQCINQLSQKPYRTNLSGTKGLYQDQSHSSVSGHNSQQQSQTQEHQNKEDNESLKDQTNQKNVKEQLQNQKIKLYDFDQKIRWSNLGYNYDWTNRSYPKTKTVMPQSIQSIAQKANSLYNELTSQQKQYVPEAVIVNFYKQKDAMTAHLDDAEEDQGSPIYSFAFGLSCVFLIGDTHKQAEPLAVRIDSGDLFIMSGHSRRCYHGVPRVISSTFDRQFPFEENQKSQPNTKLQTLNYLSNHRININIRQVYVYNKFDSI